MSDLEDLGFDPQEYADQLGYTDELGRGRPLGPECRPGRDPGDEAAGRDAS